MKILQKIIFLLFILSIRCTFLSAQVSVPGDYFNRIDKIKDSTFLTLYRSIQNNSKNNIEIINPYSLISFNSAYPRGYNDGAIWTVHKFYIDL